MDSFCDEDEEFEFFDALEEIDQECEVDCGLNCSKNWEYDVWVRSPQSVGERRRKFIGLMGLCKPDLGEKIGKKCDGCKDGVSEGDFGRVEEFPSSSLSMSSSNTEEDGVCSRKVSFSEFRNVVGDSDCRSVENQNLGKVQTPRLRSLLSLEKSGNASNKSSSAKQDEQRTIKDDCSTRKLKDSWWHKWHSMACMARWNASGDSMVINCLSRAPATKMQRVKVRRCQKKLKELSALFTGQSIQAHEGSILAMKFSPDGQYLASAGEDKVVKVWQVVEDERLDTADVTGVDPSSVCFTMNHLAELEPLKVEKDKANKPKSLRRSSDSACIIFPPKVFRILENPLHVFRGHTAEILDLSWSKDNRLLSSSVDKTVRLWRVGVDVCIGVFNHPDYVTCIQFNPVFDDYFISGSIDGKVRIWTISGSKVVQWAEMREIITAVSYRPDGKGGIVGSITGICRFFNISDNNFELNEDMIITSKKSSLKRITGFQFFPQDPNKILVSSADSHLRILDGSNVIGKYKGLRSSSNYMLATLTTDGKHIVSASDDSNVYLWNHSPGVDLSFSHMKVNKSFECFSSDSSVAIPWTGLKVGALDQSCLKSLPFWSSSCFSLTHEYLLDTVSKGSATWPEEKLPMSTPLSKSQYKLFKMSYNSSSNAHAWGLVIVTAGWDGRIRSFQNYGLPVPV